MKLYIFIVAIMSTVSVSFGQKNFSILITSGFNVASGTALDKLEGNEKASLGSFSRSLIPVGLQFRYHPTETTSVYLNYDGNIGLQSNYEITMIKIKTAATLQRITVGVNKYLTSDDFKIFVGIDAGVGFVDYVVNSPFVDMKRTHTGFTFAPKLGFDYNFSQTIFLNFDVHMIGLAGGDVTHEGNKVNEVAYTTMGGATIGIGFRL